jgi:hypothetical protein
MAATGNGSATWVVPIVAAFDRQPCRRAAHVSPDGHLLDGQCDCQRMTQHMVGRGRRYGHCAVACGRAGATRTAFGASAAR